VEFKEKRTEVRHTFHKELDNSVTIRIFSSRKATKNEIKQYEG